MKDKAALRGRKEKVGVPGELGHPRRGVGWALQRSNPAKLDLVGTFLLMPVML